MDLLNVKNKAVNREFVLKFMIADPRLLVCAESNGSIKRTGRNSGRMSDNVEIQINIHRLIASFRLR